MGPRIALMAQFENAAFKLRTSRRITTYEML